MILAWLDEVVVETEQDFLTGIRHAVQRQDAAQTEDEALTLLYYYRFMAKRLLEIGKYKGTPSHKEALDLYSKFTLWVARLIDEKDEVVHYIRARHLRGVVVGPLPKGFPWSNVRDESPLLTPSDP